MAFILFAYAAAGGAFGAWWLIDLTARITPGPPPSRPFITESSVNLLFATISLVVGVLTVGYFRLSGRVAMKAIMSAALVVGLCGLAGAQGEKTGPVGTWTCEYAVGNDKRLSTLTIKKDDDKLAGTMSWPGQKGAKLKDLKLKDGDLTFSVERELDNRKFNFEYKFTTTGDKLKGKLALEFGGVKREFDIEGKREKK